MDTTTNTISDTVVVLRNEGDIVYAVTWDADKSFTVWQVEGAGELSADLGRWHKVNTCEGDAPRNLEEATAVGEAVLKVHLGSHTVVVKT